MKLKKLSFVFMIIVVILAISAGISIAVLNGLELLKVDGAFNLNGFLRWTLWFFVFFMLIANAVVTQKFTSGKLQEGLFFISSMLVISTFLSYLVYCFVRCKFIFRDLDWIGFFTDIVNLDPLYYIILGVIFVGISLIYIFFIDKRASLFFGTGLRGKGKLHSVEANLENSRWMNAQEKNKLFKTYKFSELNNVKKDGVPVAASLTSNKKELNVRLNSPCHALAIGSTGSGKTTTFVSPMIQILGATAAGSSMVITDPKGELFSLHSDFLKSRGYDVKVIDLRDTYASYRWNPLDSIYDDYQKYATAHKNVFKRNDNAEQSGLKLMDPPESFGDEWYEFNDQAYSEYKHLVGAIKLYKKKIYDEVFEDLNDLVTILVPVENEKDPVWEKGARSITLAVLLAMLEDSEEERFGMTKAKFTFFNLAKILQNSQNDYEELRNYFIGRNKLSKALALSKQVCDAATQTRASYMSIVYDKLTLFNDSGVCALTSCSDFTSAQLNEKPTALFLKIPDEKTTRHNLAAIFILNIYKTLIKVASAKESLSLDRNVYFIMDEFGNMPKIEKFDKFITVGRSRKIWFIMIVQSYSQLNNVYGDTVADIIKGNCGIKMFIGSNDMGTCKEYSELCGNITVVTSSTSGSVHSTDTNVSSQTQVRPLIYPSELQRLNHPGDIGHSIIVTFGNYPLKTYFTPSFNVPLYKIGKMDTGEVSEQFFDENEFFYDITGRNELVIGGKKTEKVLVKEDEEKEKETEKVEEEEMPFDEAELLEQLREWKVSNKDKTIQDFFNDMSTKKVKGKAR